MSLLPGLAGMDRALPPRRPHEDVSGVRDIDDNVLLAGPAAGTVGISHTVDLLIPPMMIASDDRYSRCAVWQGAVRIIAPTVLVAISHLRLFIPFQS